MTERLIDSVEQKRHPKPWQYAVHHAVSRVAIFSSFIGMPAVVASVENIRDNIAETEAAQIEVYAREDALDESNNDIANVFINGFGTYNAHNIVSTFGQPFQEHVQDGQLWSVSYGNAFLSIDEIAEKIVSKAVELDVKEVNLIGYSAGGDIAVAVNDALRSMTALEVPLIVGVSTPDGTETLRKHIQEMVRTYLKTLDDFPLLAYYDPARFIGEAMLRAPRYTNNDGTIDLIKFSETMGGIVDDLNNKYFPSTQLLYDQYQAIENINLEDLITDITGKYGDNLLNPTLAYIGTAKDENGFGYDYMVDDKTAGENFCRYATQAGLNCIISNTAGAIHTQPEKTPDAYADTFERIGPILQGYMDEERNRFDIVNKPIPFRGPNNPV